MADLILNQAPIDVPFSQNVKTQVATEGFNVVTITPSSNFSANYRIDFGSQPILGEVGTGSPIPMPICQSYNNSTVTVNNLNTQEGSNFKAGIYGFNQDPTKVLENVDINQYESAGRQTSTGIQTLTMTNRSSESVLLICIVGTNEPQCIALNTDASSLPPAYQNLKNLVCESGNTHQMSKNWYGQYMYIINISLTASNVNVRIQ